MKNNIQSKVEYEKIMEEILALMNKGEEELTKKESEKLRSMALAAQEYEQKYYPVEMPKTLIGMIELKMYEKKLNQLQLAEKLGLSAAKLSLILNGKQKPDVEFLKGIREVLNIDADFILDHV
ncbi:MAG: helix-turn-helix domain-containing protein [Chitinophagaceae bacterium]|nr:helix-turn-helix domain-containing protein [Chitinophagaceae bacterium]